MYLAKSSKAVMVKTNNFRFFLLITAIIVLAYASSFFASKLWYKSFVFPREHSVSIDLRLILILIICWFLLLLTHNILNDKLSFSLSVLILLAVSAAIFYNAYSQQQLVTATRYGGSGTLLVALNTSHVSHREILSRYTSLMKDRAITIAGTTYDLRNHSQTTHPPGQLLLYYSVFNNPVSSSRLNRSIHIQDLGSYSTSLLVAIFSCLTVASIYIAVRNLSTHSTALLASCMALGVIAFYGYISYFDSINMLLTVIGLILLLKKDSYYAFLLAGLTQAANAAISYNVLPIVILLPILATFGRPIDKPTLKYLAYILPLILMILTYQYFSFNYLWGMSQSLSNIKNDFNITVSSYGLGLWRNTSLIINQFGILNTIIIITSVSLSIFKIKSSKANYPILIICLFLLGALISGQSRGEMARTMMFLYTLGIIYCFPLLEKLTNTFNKHLLFSVLFFSEIYITLTFFRSFTLSHIFIQ